ncbi:MAG: relaxase domain-containing protein, partial [Bacteroidetes bacterium]|nr:relaxase domain-containing protein [Bacteroidota bacterium]
MFQITVSKDAKSATKYFEEGLSKQDYYSEKQEIKGRWHGEMAERLGLSGEVTKSEFEKLASNINPESDEKL